MRRLLVLSLAVLLLAACGEAKETPRRAEEKKPPGAAVGPRVQAPVQGEKSQTFRAGPGGTFGEGGR